MREIARWDLDVASLVIPDSDPELANAALAALLIAAGRGARPDRTPVIASPHHHVLAFSVRLSPRVLVTRVWGYLQAQPRPAARPSPRPWPATATRRTPATGSRSTG